MQAHRISRKSGGPYVEQRLESRQLQRAKSSAPKPHSPVGAVAKTQPPDADIATPAVDTHLP